MAGGYAGKILKVNLTTRTISTIDSKPYTDKYGGAHGVGSALFWEDVVEPGNWDMLDGHDSRNQISIMAGPFTGTAVPCTGRAEVQFVGPQKYPVNWFTRSGFGGRFGAMMKLAGWDGIVVQGKATSPVWINIVNDDVTLEDAGPDGDNLWGMTTWEAMEEIWRKVKGGKKFGEWQKLPGDEYTTQLPAVVACGPCGEAALSRVGALVSDAGSGSGQGGSGSVFGSKNLKAISVLGTRSLEIDDPAALVDTRIWHKKTFGYNVDTPLRPGRGVGSMGFPAGGTSSINFTNIRRVTGCFGASQNCRQQTYTGSGNESQCTDQSLIVAPTKRDQARAADLGQMYGFNFFPRFHEYLRDLAAMGVLGPGKAIESTPLNMDIYGTVPWAEEYMRSAAARRGIGDDIAEGDLRASLRWGRYEEDSGPSRLLNLIHWGDRWHHAAEKWWLYMSLFSDRDANSHSGLYASFNIAYQLLGSPHEIGPEEMANQLASRNGYGSYTPFAGDPTMLSQTWQGSNYEYMDDAVETGWYSAGAAKEAAWHIMYDRFWQQGMGMCCWNWGAGAGANFHNWQKPDFRGITPEGEERFLNAVTGKNYTFTEGMEIGKRVWMLDRAIWVLQGRHRDMEHFTASRQYEYPGTPWGNRAMPMYINGAWEYQNYNLPETSPFSDREGTEILKTHFYDLMGLDNTNGWPTRATLEALDLGFVADKLQAEGKLGV